MPTDSHLFLTIVIYFVLISTILALTFGDEISQIDLQPTINFSLSEANFIEMRNLSDINHIVLDGGWNTNLGRGIYSTQQYSFVNLILSEFFGDEPDTHAKNTIAFTYIEKPANSIYKTNYSIYNPEHNRIKIYYFYGKLLTFGRAGVLLDEDGFYFPVSSDQNYIEELTTKPFLESDALNNSYLNFTTEFDTSTSVCKFYYGGDLISSEIVQPIRYEFFSIVGNQHYHAVVETWGKDTEILDVDSTLTLIIDEDTVFSITDFFRTVIQFFVWDVPDEIMPPMFKIIFISIALIGIIFIILRFIRGVG